MSGWDAGGAERAGTQELCSSSVPVLGSPGTVGLMSPLKLGSWGPTAAI